MNNAPGDLVFCHSKGIVSLAIRWAERLRWRHASQWNHVAIIDRVVDGKTYVIQAEGKGVTNIRTLDEVAPGGSYIIVRPPQSVDVESLLHFARKQVGAQYGFLTIAAVALSLILPWFITVRIPNTWICSALAAESLRAGGWIHDWPDLYLVSPAQLRLALS